METNMTNEKSLDILERHNLWRRGADYVEATDPKLLGMALDKAIKVLRLSNVVGSKPTAFEKNNLPLKIRYAFCEAIEMYHNIQAYEMGLVDKTDFINHSIAIKDKYK